MVDGVTLDPTTPLSRCGLTRGSTVGIGIASRAPGLDLVVVAGPLVPTRVRVDGTVLIGRGVACDLRLDHPSVAPAHALIETTPVGARLCPLVPTAAPEVDGDPVTRTTPLNAGAVIGIGAIDLQLVPPPPPPTRRSGPSPLFPTTEGEAQNEGDEDRATTPVHRAPRVGGALGADPGPAPEPPVPEPPPRPPGALTLLAPVVVGGILAVTVHPTAGLFTAATPLLAVGAHLDARRRWRRDGRRAEAAHAAERTEHQQSRAVRDREAATDQRWHHPSPADALDRARHGRDLWPVRTEVGGAVVGLGWYDDDIRAPVTVTLGDGDHLGIAGPEPWAEAMARAVAIEALTRRGPHEQRVDGSTDGGWAFLRWAPHRDGDGPPLTVGGGAGGAATGFGIEVAARVAELTDRCRVVVAWSPDGATLLESAVAVRPFVVDRTLAEDWGRAVARWTDPGAGGSALPDRVRLPGLLTPAPDEDRSGRRSLRAPLGVGPDGVFAVDLVADGPHALVAGTTGAGKSELLRTWVASLAARHPPTSVAFVLVDYKGGSAFDACARLPHVAGVVTDLDAGLGERLLTGLRAEVREREARLRTEGVADLRDLDGGPARLVVVVDEFATLAAELPDFLGALVDVARRGRSLGIHLVLATQRPAGAVNDDIRANTALRLCLRTLDPADSQDVIGGPEAAALPARAPGRAWVRTDAGLRLLQVADSGARDDALAPVAVRIVGSPWPATADGGPTDLDALVDAAVRGWGDQPTTNAVWRPPLPEQLALTPGPADRLVVLGRQDRPAERSQPPLTWDPGAGHLVVLGGRGLGRTTTLRTALLALAATRAPDTLHAYVVGRPGPLDDLVGLPHLGAVVAVQDRPSLGRLLRRLEARLERVEGRAEPLTVVVLDGYETLAADVGDLDGLRLLGAVDRLARDGPRHGIVLALSSSRPSLQPPSLATTTSRLVVLGLDDPVDYGLLGLRPPPTGSPPGRGRTAEGHEVQIGRLDLDPTAVAARYGPIAAGRGPAPVAPLPDRVILAALASAPGRATVGLRDRDLAVATVALGGDGPFVVTGPPRSGRTTALAVLRAQAPALPVTHHQPGDDPDRLRQEVRDWLADPRPHLFVVDDAEHVEDPDDGLRSLVTRRHPDAVVLVAVRADAWRTGYGSWLAALRPAGRGLALRPDPVHDAESWTYPLPSVGPSPPPGRGVLIGDNAAEIIQVAVVDA